VFLQDSDKAMRSQAIEALGALEIKLFAARLLRGYGWELLPDQDLEMVVIPTPKPRDGLKVRFWQL
jgi:cytochrome P450